MHGSWSHIVGNTIFLWAFAPEIEDAMGPGRYLVFYLLGGLVAMLSQIVADPHSTIPNLGASGAIAAVMGAFLVTYPRDQIKAVLFLFVFGSWNSPELRLQARSMHSPETNTLHAWFDLYRGIYARVAKRLKVDPSTVSRVARRKRRSPSIERALLRELARIDKRRPRFRT